MSNVKFKSSVKLDKVSLAKVSAFAKEKGVTTLPEATIDLKLIAGFVLEIDGTEYDYSLKGALNRLSKALEV